MRITQRQDNWLDVELSDGETLATLEGPGVFVVNPMPGLLVWDALVASGKAPNIVDNAQQVSDTQFIQALAEDNYALISWQEAQDWGAQGILPKLLVTALDKIPDTATRNRAYMKARSAKSYIYSDKWVQSILVLLPQDVVAKMPGTDAQDKLQQLFNFAATL